MYEVMAKPMEVGLFFEVMNEMLLWQTLKLAKYEEMYKHFESGQPHVQENWCDYLTKYLKLLKDNRKARQESGR